MMFLAFTGFNEWWIILLVVVVLFGAKKLPALARAMGSSINQFKHGLADEAEKKEKLEESAKESE